MNLETTVTDELREVGAAVRPPPPPDAAFLVRKAEHARTRRLVRSGVGVVLAAAIVLAIVALGTHLKNPDAEPVPTPEPTVLPTGKPPQIPFIENETLYVRGLSRPGSWLGTITHQATTMAYLNDDHNGASTIVLFHDGAEIGRFPDVTTSALSAEGRKAAFAQRQGKDWFLVVYDVESLRVQGRLPAGAVTLGHVGEEGEAWETISSVDENGQVSWGSVVAQHTWTPGTAPVDSKPKDPEPPSGQFPVEDAVVSVSPDGAWGVWNEDHTGDQVVQGSTETPDQYDVHVYAQRPGQPGTRIEFPLPSNVLMGGADWETPETFLTQVFEDPTGISWHYVRCFIPTKRCEVAPTP